MGYVGCVVLDAFAKDRESLYYTVCAVLSHVLHAITQPVRVQH